MINEVPQHVTKMTKQVVFNSIYYKQQRKCKEIKSIPYLLEESTHRE